MKNKFLRIICMLLVCCTFGLAGCLGQNTMPGGDYELPDDVANTANNAEDILNTKDNVTYYYNSLEDLMKDRGKDADDRDNLQHTFGDAYVFVDPGPGTAQEPYYYVDHFTGRQSIFSDLVKREVELLTQILYTAINKIYGDGKVVDNDLNNITNDLYLTSKSYTFAEDATNSLNVLPEEYNHDELYYDENIDLNDIYTYGVVSGYFDNVAMGDYRYGIDKTIIYDDPSTTDVNEEVVLQENFLNTRYAIWGGQTLKIVSNGSLSYAYFDETTMNEDEVNHMWACIPSGTVPDSSGGEGIKEDLVGYLESAIVCALAGIEFQDYNADGMGGIPDAVYEKIDHLGFTETDKVNLKEQILNNVIGDKAVKKDKEYLEDLQSVFSMSEDNVIYNIDTAPNDTRLQSMLYSTDDEVIIKGQYYKGYEVVIEGLLEQALTCNIEINDGAENETCFINFPRIQILKMDSFDLMDQQVDGVEDNENVDPDDIDVDELPEDPETIEFEEKFSKYEKIIGILLLPNQVIGDRSMAIKENGEWVKDDEGHVKLKTFTVDGFILSAVDLVLISEEDKMATIKADVKVKTATKEMTVSSDFAEVGYVKPDPGEEASYITTEAIDCDKQELIQKEESDAIYKDEESGTEYKVSEYRIQGYNGLEITDNGTEAYIVLEYDEEGEAREVISLEPTQVEDYKEYNLLSTIMHRYISISSIDGAGYKLNVDNFAGDNFVLVNFPIYAVNDDSEVRDCDFNILYFYLDCI